MYGKNCKIHAKNTTLTVSVALAASRVEHGTGPTDGVWGMLWVGRGGRGARVWGGKKKRGVVYE